jgi:hypothetical protein
MDGTLADALRPHLDDCDECRFLQSLSKNLAGAAAHQSEGPLGAPLHTLLAAALESGEPLLGRYRLKRRIGGGGFGEVYRVVDTETDEVVALKVVRLREDDRSTDEIRNARLVVHPNVCRVFHTEHYGDLRLIVMELVDGATLDPRAPRTRAEALAIFRGIAEGVKAAHDVGVLHLDLKPHNVLLRDGRTPLVTDFGLSVRVLAGQTSRRVSGGTPAYMAPEQRDGRDVDRRTDVYALGLILRDLLGARPRGMKRVIRRATATDPRARYADVAQLVRALDVRRRVARWIMRVGVAVTALVAMMLALALIVPPPRGPRAHWRADLWGHDPIPADAWNVARNPRRKGLPRVITGRGFGCGQRADDLLDGLAEYGNWEHGFAFPPPRDVCINLDAFAPQGSCGEARSDAHLCEILDDGPSSSRTFRALPETVADRERIPRERWSHLGQLEEGVPCGERSVTVELDRPERVFAVRTWHFQGQNVPRSYRILVDDHVVFATTEAIGSDPTAANVEPLTAQFEPVTARKIEILLDTCTTHDGHGWLYEVEVFAHISRLDAWRRLVAGDD